MIKNLRTLHIFETFHKFQKPAKLNNVLFTYIMIKHFKKQMNDKID